MAAGAATAVGHTEEARCAEGVGPGQPAGGGGGGLSLLGWPGPALESACHLNPSMGDRESSGYWGCLGPWHEPRSRESCGEWVGEDLRCHAVLCSCVQTGPAPLQPGPAVLSLLPRLAPQPGSSWPAPDSLRVASLRPPVLSAHSGPDSWGSRSWSKRGSLAQGEGRGGWALGGCVRMCGGGLGEEIGCHRPQSGAHSPVVHGCLLISLAAGTHSLSWGSIQTPPLRCCRAGEADPALLPAHSASDTTTEAQRDQGGLKKKGRSRAEAEAGESPRDRG